MKNIYINLLHKLGENIPLALATIIETKGSTPQVQGASALFSAEGLITGTLGGGILEADALKKSINGIRRKTSQLYEFDLSSDISSDENPICGGKVVILIDAHPDKNLNIFRAVERSLTKRHPGVMVTCAGGNTNGIIEIKRYWIEKDDLEDSGLKPELAGFKNDIKRSLDEDIIQYIEAEKKYSNENFPGNIIFLEPIFPLPRLVIAGAGHIGQAVSHIGNLLEFEITVIDDRPEYANHDKIPDADHFITGDIGKAIHDIPKDPDTYILIVTHGHRGDAEALRQCINSDAGYIGMIGSKRKIKLTREKFLTEGWTTPELFDRVHAPVGIGIMSKTVQEIAVSICAQLILERHQKQKKKNISVISIIILAAGESKRMGQPKLLLPYGDRTIIETVVSQATSSEADNVIVVLGSEKGKIRSQLLHQHILFTENAYFHTGMLSSVQCGLRTIPGNTDAVMILLGDQPMITDSVINKTIEAYRQTEKGIVIAAHEGKRGHPIILDVKYRDEIEQLSPEKSLHDFIRKNSGDILEIEVEDPVILRDIDTKNDYYKEIKYRRSS